MNLLKLFTEIEKVDPEVYDRFDSRRAVFKHLSTAGKSMAAAALPAMLSSMFTRAYGQSGALPTDIANILNFALKLEYLEYHFYNKALNTAGLIPAGAGRDALTAIRNDENNHVMALRQTLGTQAIAALPETAFDYTGSKNGARAALFPTVFSDYNILLAVAQAFEDTGVRAYKGAAPGLMANKTVLTAALNIHSVEARHASHIRTMRRGGPGVAGAGTGASPKSWISGTDGGGPAPSVTSGIYVGEDNVTQGGVNLQTTLNQPAAAVSEAFDEPLDATAVTNIALNFVVANTF